MRIVVDTNRIIAALIKDSISRKIIQSLKAEFVTISLSKNEVMKYKWDIIKKSGLTENEFFYLFNRIMDKMIVLDDELIWPFMQQAKNIMDHIDPADTPFIALALATDSMIWSDDKDFDKQKKVKVLKTYDLNAYLN